MPDTNTTPEAVTEEAPARYVTLQGTLGPSLVGGKVNDNGDVVGGTVHGPFEAGDEFVPGHGCDVARLLALGVIGPWEDAPVAQPADSTEAESTETDPNGSAPPAGE